MIKKGFSMIELLFVMIILAALASISIPNVKGGEEAAILTSMRLDTKNIINLLTAKFIEKQDYSEIINANLRYFQIETEENYKKGFSARTLIDGTKIPISKNNVFSIINYAVGEGSCNGNGQGFLVTVSNININKEATFDSCRDSHIKIDLPQTIN